MKTRQGVLDDFQDDFIGDFQAGHPALQRFAVLTSVDPPMTQPLEAIGEVVLQ